MKFGWPVIGGSDLEGRIVGMRKSIETGAVDIIGLLI